jgi:hypothetical protein
MNGANSLQGAAKWPVVARAQQRERIQSIGLIIGGYENDPF